MKHQTGTAKRNTWRSEAIFCSGLCVRNPKDDGFDKHFVFKDTPFFRIHDVTTRVIHLGGFEPSTKVA